MVHCKKAMLKLSNSDIYKVVAGPNNVRVGLPCWLVLRLRCPHRNWIGHFYSVCFTLACMYFSLMFLKEERLPIYTYYESTGMETSANICLDMLCRTSWLHGVNDIVNGFSSETCRWTSQRRLRHLGKCCRVANRGPEESFFFLSRGQTSCVTILLRGSYVCLKSKMFV